MDGVEYSCIVVACRYCSCGASSFNRDSACGGFIWPDDVCPILLLRTVAAIGCDADCWCYFLLYCVIFRGDTRASIKERTLAQGA